MNNPISLVAADGWFAVSGTLVKEEYGLGMGLQVARSRSILSGLMVEVTNWEKKIQEELASHNKLKAEEWIWMWFYRINKWYFRCHLWGLWGMHPALFLERVCWSTSGSIADICLHLGVCFNENTQKLEDDEQETKRMEHSDPNKEEILVSVEDEHKFLTLQLLGWPVLRNNSIVFTSIWWSKYVCPKRVY